MRLHSSQRFLLDAVPHMVWIASADGRDLFFNRCGHVGLDLPQPLTPGWSWLDLVHDDDRAPAAQAWAEALHAGSPLIQECRVRNPAKLYHRHAVRADPVRRTGGAIAFWAGHFFDVEETRRLASDRDRLLAQLRLQIERMPLGYIHFNAELRVVEGNQAAERIFGYSRAGAMALAAPWVDLFQPASRPRMQQAVAGLRQSEDTVRLVCANLARDGRAIACEWNCIPWLEDGRFAGMLALVEDVTERQRKAAEMALLTMAMEQAGEAVVITNPEGDIKYVNPAFTRITGYSSAEVIGRNPRLLNSGAQGGDFYRRLWRQILQGQVWQGEIVNRRKNGELYTEEMSIAPVLDADGDIAAFLATKRDVTERNRMAEQFRQAQKMEAVGRLAGGVAHDFNNLLTVINGYSEMALERLAPGDPLRPQLDAIRQAGERAVGLTRQLLAFSRKQVLNPKVLDLNSVVDNFQSLLQRLIGEDIVLALRHEPRLGRVKADPGQIEQVLMNLCVNARDAMPEGGTLTLETRNVTVPPPDAGAPADTFPHDLAPGEYVALAVQDNGTGMTEQVQAHLFEPFFTTKAMGKGTGLGLAMVFGILKQSGGTITARSQPGRGSTFTLFLPRVDAADTAPLPAPAEPGRMGAGTILLVEDEESVRALTAAILEQHGYRVLVCATPEEALRSGHAYAGAIDLLLTDMIMPQLSGRKIAEALAPVRPRMKVLFMSGYTEDPALRDGIAAAQTAFLQKPFTAAALVAKVAETLSAAGPAGGSAQLSIF